jgi:GT2 family glycosyltransferase
MSSNLAAAVPDLSIIIVNWNVRDLLRACLHAIAETAGELVAETIVVDSASADDSVAMIETEFPWVRLIACDENVGFPRGNNLGLAQARGAHILLLNPDTVLRLGALQTMVAYLQSNPTVGAVGPKLLNPDGSVQSSRRRFPTMTTMLYESTWLEGVAPATVLDQYYARDLSDDETADVDWVTGACIMVPRAVVEQVGGLDEGYYMYSEELDWCRRIKDAGWRVVYLPAAEVVHHVGKSSEQAVTARHINFQRAKLRYARTYYGASQATMLRAYLLASYSGQLAVEAAKGLVGHRRDLRWQRVHSYYEVLRSGLRPAGY